MSETMAVLTRHRTLFNRWLIVNWRLEHHGGGATYTALLSVVYGIKLRPKRQITVQYAAQLRPKRHFTVQYATKLCTKRHLVVQ